MEVKELKILNPLAFLKINLVSFQGDLSPGVIRKIIGETR